VYRACIGSEFSPNVQRVPGSRHPAAHALVRDDGGVQTWSPDGVVCWVGIIIENHINARISVNGKISEIHDVSLEEFIAALDEAQRLISANN
jgi:hypothetical protein